MSERLPITVVIGSSFTAEPIRPSLRFWMTTLGLPGEVVLAPYGLLIQALLDPGSAFGRNAVGLNVLLVRTEDWLRVENDQDVARCPAGAARAKIDQGTGEIAEAIRRFARTSRAPLVAIFAPGSPAAEATFGDAFMAAEARLCGELAQVSGVTVVSSRELRALYPVIRYHDPVADAAGHIPFTPEMFAALGTMVARRLHRLMTRAPKVIVLDADHTLWRGVVAEDGLAGIQVDLPRQALQEFMVAQQEGGRLLCLCSKNAERDVAEVFARHPEMALKRRHFTAWKVNWRPKSENVRELATELGLALDSFVLIDDNPAECAEVEANCPGVVALPLPAQPEAIPRFLRHVWALDLAQTTAEDRNRTVLYQQNLRREQLRAEVGGFADFLARLQLEVVVTGMVERQVSRVAQLIERTNQFNFTAERSSEVELAGRVRAGEWECLVTSVRDRFGDYGLVGVVLFQARGGDLGVDTFLLSCRVLGKGVEHRMLARLGEIAVERGLGCVEARYVPTPRNRPAYDFLEALEGAHKQVREGCTTYRIPAPVAARCQFKPSDAPEPSPAGTGPSKPSEVSDGRGAAFAGSGGGALQVLIASELWAPDQVLTAASRATRLPRPALSAPYRAPRHEIEEALAGIWARALGLERVGVEDNYLELGGDSITSVQIASLALQEGIAVSPRQLFQHQTVAEMSAVISRVATPGAMTDGTGPVAEFPEARLTADELEDVARQLE